MLLPSDVARLVLGNVNVKSDEAKQSLAVALANNDTKV